MADKVSRPAVEMVGPLLDLFDKLATTTADGRVTQTQLRNEYLKDTGFDATAGINAWHGFLNKYYRAVNHLVQGGTLKKQKGTHEKRWATYLYRPEKKQLTDGE